MINPNWFYRLRLFFIYKKIYYEGLRDQDMKNIKSIKTKGKQKKKLKKNRRKESDGEKQRQKTHQAEPVLKALHKIISVLTFRQALPKIYSRFIHSFS